MYDVGCICHLANFTIKAGLKELPMDTDKFFVDIFFMIFNIVAREEMRAWFEASISLSHLVQYQIFCLTLSSYLYCCSSTDVERLKNWAKCAAGDCISKADKLFEVHRTY